jgi:hypothetical protein
MKHSIKFTNPGRLMSIGMIGDKVPNEENKCGGPEIEPDVVP